MFNFDKDMERMMQAKKREILAEMESAKARIMEELACVDKVTMTRLQGALEGYNAVRLELERVENDINLVLEAQFPFGYVREVVATAVADYVTDTGEAFLLLTNITHEKGSSETLVPSQKFVTEEFAKLDNTLTVDSTDGLGNIRAYEMKAGKTYVFTRTKTGGEMNVNTRPTLTGTNTAVIRGISGLKSAEFTPETDQHYIYVYSSATDYAYTIYEKGTALGKLADKDAELEGRINDLTLCSVLIEQGGIDTAGYLVDSDQRLRTKEFIHGERRIECPNGIVVFRVYYFNAETLTYDSYVTVNNKSANIGKEGCVAKVVFTKTLSTNPIKPEELKSSLAIEKIGADVDKINAQLPPMVKFDIDHNIKDITNEMRMIDYSTPEKRKTILEQVYSLFDRLGTVIKDGIVMQRIGYEKIDVAETLGIAYPEYACGVVDSDVYESTPAYRTYMYKFSYENNHLGNNGNNKRKKLLITSGIHGNEIAAPFNTYLFAKQLCDNFYADANFFKLRSAFDVYIIPCVNGYGMYHGTRGNANKVNINRNFPVKRWAVGGESTKDSATACNYTGAYANSEFETQLITGITSLINPDIAIDHHNYGGEQNWQFYTDVNEKKFLRLVYQSLADCSYTFIKEFPEYFGYDFTMVVNKDGTAPATLLSTDSGTLARWWYEFGVPFDATIEISHSINYKNGVYTSAEEQYLNKDVFTVGEYTLRNQLLRYCQWLMDNHN